MATTPFEGSLLGAAPIFTVADLGNARAFYVEKLGFEVSFEYGDPVFFHILDRDDFSLHLVESSVGKRQPGSGNAYVFSTEIDFLAAEFKAKGVELTTGPESYDYGMREIALTDPDGNQLVFGAEVSEPG